MPARAGGGGCGVRHTPRSTSTPRTVFPDGVAVIARAGYPNARSPMAIPSTTCLLRSAVNTTQASARASSTQPTRVPGRRESRRADNAEQSEAAHAGRTAKRRSVKHRDPRSAIRIEIEGRTRAVLAPTQDRGFCAIGSLQATFRPHVNRGGAASLEQTRASQLSRRTLHAFDQLTHRLRRSTSRGPGFASRPSSSVPDRRARSAARPAESRSDSAHERARRARGGARLLPVPSTPSPLALS